MSFEDHPMPPSSPPLAPPREPNIGGAIALLAWLGLGAPFVLFCLASWFRAFVSKYGPQGRKASADILTASTKKLFASAKPVREAKDHLRQDPEAPGGGSCEEDCCETPRISACGCCCWIGVGVFLWWLMLEWIIGQLDPELVGLPEYGRGWPLYVFSAALYLCVFFLCGASPCNAPWWAQSMNYIDLASVRRNQGAAPFKQIASIQGIAPVCIFRAVDEHEVYNPKAGENEPSHTWKECGTHVEQHVIENWEDASPGLPDAWKGAGLLSVELDVELTFGSEGAKAAYMKARSDFEEKHRLRYLKTISSSRDGRECYRTDEVKVDGDKRRMNFYFSVAIPNQHFPVASYKAMQYNGMTVSLCTADWTIRKISGQPDSDGNRLVEMTPGAKPRILSATGYWIAVMLGLGHCFVLWASTLSRRAKYTFVKQVKLWPGQSAELLPIHQPPVPQNMELADVQSAPSSSTRRGRFHERALAELQGKKSDAGAAAATKRAAKDKARADQVPLAHTPILTTPHLSVPYTCNAFIPNE